jgi:2-amino-4-hydroxy-6-hydroxymethyldihydropteridine diphosphokinase
MQMNPTVLLGLGSNLPWQALSSQALIGAAVRGLAEFAHGPVICSPLYRTSPVDCPPDSGDFVNAAAVLRARAGLAPMQLLEGVKRLELAFGRSHDSVRNAPRPLDVDVLAFGDLEMRSARLTLPHPRAWQRAFVLVPLNDVAPDFVWPGKGLTVKQLLRRLDTDENVQRLPAACSQP